MTRGKVDKLVVGILQHTLPESCVGVVMRGKVDKLVVGNLQHTLPESCVGVRM